MISAIVVVCIVGFALFAISDSTPKPQESYPTMHQETSSTIGFTETELPEETLSEEERNQIIRDAIDKAVLDWVAGEITFEEASSFLMDIQQTSNAELADYARAQLDFITIEHEGNTAFDLAQKFLNAKNYPQVFTQLNSVNQTYTQYDNILELYKSCEEKVLQAVANPTSIEEFEQYIQLLENCGKLYESKALSDRITALSEELTIFIDITETIDAATVQFDSQNVEEAFVLLVLGLNKYPDNEMLATTLVDYRDHYIITITKQVVELCQQEEYKQALTIVETAIEEYDCVEFQMLLEAIKEEKSFLYRLKNDIVETFTSLSNGWKEEEFNVKQAANDAGAYVVKSGKKLALGDYTNEEITLLSFSGNVAASLLGADLLFDLRDLSYDITHWGEEEYFAVWLAADVVAILPVIGVVKYLSHFKTITNGTEVASELVDSVADVGKNADNAADLVDTISDVTKTGDDIVDAIDNSKDAVRAGEAAKDVASDVVKGYTLIDTINQKLLGQAHEKTGVKFVLSKIELSDGRKIKGVFPHFDSFVDIELPKELYKADFNKQQKECLEQLQSKLKNPFNKLHDKFTEDQVEDIMNGVLPEGFTWHHNEQEGLMQLVDTLIHSQTNHTGGMSIWGSGHR